VVFQRLRERIKGAPKRPLAPAHSMPAEAS
jgi:hypothetical protein